MSTSELVESNIVRQIQKGDACVFVVLWTRSGADTGDVAMDVVRRGEPSSLFQLEEQAKKYSRGIRKSLRELHRLYRILDRSEKEKMAEILRKMSPFATTCIKLLT